MWNIRTRAGGRGELQREFKTTHSIPEPQITEQHNTAVKICVENNNIYKTIMMLILKSFGGSTYIVLNIMIKKYVEKQNIALKKIAVQACLSEVSYILVVVAQVK